MPDGETLAVAVGGILTHPEEGRTKLNIPEMNPSLVYMNANSGQLISRHQLPPRMRKLSLRHLSVNGEGLLCFGLQNEGPKWEYPALVGTHRMGEDLRLLEAPIEIWQGMKNYCGSVAFDATGKILAASSPRGNMISFWEAGSGQHLYATQATDGCGIAPDGEEGSFLITCGTGEILRVGCFPFHDGYSKDRGTGPTSLGQSSAGHDLTLSPESHTDLVNEDLQGSSPCGQNQLRLGSASPKLAASGIEQAVMEGNMQNIHMKNQIVIRDMNHMDISSWALKNRRRFTR